VGTRINRLDQGEFDAIILAAAGVKRLGTGARIRAYLEPSVILPAIGQGAIGIECRANAAVTDLIQPLNHPETHLCILAERAVNRRLYGGCQVPIAGFAELTGREIFIRALVGRTDGSEIIRDSLRGPVHEAEALGVWLAEKLLSQGAGSILRELMANAAGQ
jgi:hydroxymethylbilane synthase